jgi:hypothetical protein
MTTPLTTEMPQQLEPVTHDPFIDDLEPPAPEAAHRLAAAGREADENRR